MVSNNRAAHQMFKQNSERLQQSADARRENQNQDASQSKTAASASDKNRDYGALKREQAQATPSQAGGERTQDKAAQDRPLSFVKDHERGARAQLKTEAAKDAPQSKGQGLTFVKDQSQGIDRGR